MTRVMTFAYRATLPVAVEVELGLPPTASVKPLSVPWMVPLSTPCW